MHNKTILLFGMPRSGTTWIGKIFDSHPNTLYMHEPDSWQRLDDFPLFLEEDYIAVEKRQLLNDFSTSLLTMKAAEVTSKLPIFKKNYQTFLHFQCYRMSLYLSSFLHKVSVCKNVDPIERVPLKKMNSPCVVWKSIESLGRMSYFSETIENAKCLHIVRNPAGYISSVIRGEEKKTFQSATPSSEDYQLFDLLLETSRGKSLGYSLSDLKNLSPIERLAIRWRLYNEIAYDQCQNHSNYQLLMYENMCRNPLEKTKKIFDFCDLSWNEQTANFVNESISQNKDAYYSVFKSPLEAAYKWKSNLSRKDVDDIINILSGSVAFSWYENDFLEYQQ